MELVDNSIFVVTSHSQLEHCSAFCTTGFIFGYTQFYILINAKMVFYVGSMAPSRFFLGSDFTQPEIPDHGSLRYQSKYNVSSETACLEPAARFKLVMERKHISSFLDRDQESQLEMDLDLLPLWEERQDRVQDQLISAYLAASIYLTLNSKFLLRTKGEA